MSLTDSTPLLGSLGTHIDFTSACEAAKKQKFLPDDTDTIGQLFYLVVFNPRSGQSPLRSRHVELIRQYKLLEHPHTCLERNHCQIMGAGGVGAALLGCLSLRLVASHYYWAALATGVATAAAGALAYMGFRSSPKDTHFIQNEAREELKESYTCIASKLVDLQTQNPSLAKRIAVDLSPDTIQIAISAVTKDRSYASTVCRNLHEAKKLVLSKTSPLPTRVPTQAIDMHEFL